jgi:RNA polymerase sigma-70 factor, ECF subfamily
VAGQAHPISGITEQLQNWGERQDTEAGNALFNLVYDELRRQAHRYLQKERKGHTLQTTALVHEAYLKLSRQNVEWESRSHFYGVAATMMRRILLDYAKTKYRVRRGGRAEDLPLETALTVAVGDAKSDLLELDQALSRLAQKEERLARIVELRFFGGLDVTDTAEVLGVSESTVKRDWQMAKAWLHRELTPPEVNVVLA